MTDIDQQWKSVDDELPTGGYYLTYKDGEMKLTKLTREFCEDAIPEIISIFFSHWMPLPSAPT